MLTIAPAAALPAQASSTAATLEPRSLARAQTIRVQLDSRYRVLPGRGLAVTEATSTGVVESFTLLTPDLLEARLLPADNGIYYAICPVRARCPYPAPRVARPAADFLPRQLALELAIRTFLETSANVVAVSLPTPRFVLFVVERGELAREVDMPALARALSGDPADAPAARLQQTVDQLTRPRVFVVIGLEPTPTGRDTLGAVPRWPTVSAGGNAPIAATGSAMALSRDAAATVPAAEVNARGRLIPRKLAVAAANTYDVPARLNDVAHVYSLGVGEVRCPAQAEWEGYYGSAFAWGSTNLRDDYATLAPFICEGALNVGNASVPLWQQAAGVWVLVHEAFHLRHWRFRRNEAKVACQAIVYFRDGAMRLGASEAQAEELYPYALALHIRQTELFSWYRDGECREPLWVPPVP
jgi:hypothetical protein